MKGKVIAPLLASHAFDISLFEAFLPLLSGGTAIMLDNEEIKDLFLLTHRLKSVNSFHAVPALMNRIVEHICANDMTGQYSGVEDLFIGGDMVPTKVLSSMRRVFPSADIHVLYGPTEASIFATRDKYGTCETIMRGAVVGKPILNKSIYIIDEGQNLLPIGVPGEICIGGNGLARGYLNQESLTKERFVVNPFRHGEWMYKTGDIGRWLADGNIEFIGRKDEQVKIRGYRIELGEIEHALGLYESIEAGVVVARVNGEGEKELVAYVVSGETMNVSDIRRHLSRYLPDYMVPGHYIQIREIPLTGNGKIDKKSLADATGEELGGGVGYVAPCTSTEKRLAGIWEAILDRSQIGVRDDFFELGGHSLKATRLSGRIHREFEVKLALRELFTYTVLGDQAALIDRMRRTAFMNIEAVAEQDSYGLSSSQRRLWILSQFEGANIAYNMPGVYVFEGELSREGLLYSFRALIDRHEILRTVFREEESGEVRQYIRSKGEVVFNIYYEDLWEGGLGEEQESKIRMIVREELLRPFDLSEGPLLRAGLYRTGEARWVFTYTMHHIISDGWSMGVVIRELLLLYSAYIKGEPDPLPPLRIQYKDYASWQREQLSGDRLVGHQRYWLEQFEGELPVLELAGDRPRPMVKTYQGGMIQRTISRDLVTGLRGLGQDQGATLFMCLLAVVKVLLYRYTGQEDIVVGSPIAGREHADLEGQIGFYVNMLVLRTRFNGSDNFKEVLSKVMAVTFEAYEHQVYPCDELVNDLNLRRDVSRNALFDIMVVLHNTEPGQINNAPVIENLRIDGYTDGEYGVSKFDVTFNFAEINSLLQYSIEYNSDIFQKETAELFGVHLEQLLKSIIASPDIPIGALDYLSEQEKERLLKFSNRRLRTR